MPSEAPSNCRLTHVRDVSLPFRDLHRKYVYVNQSGLIVSAMTATFPTINYSIYVFKCCVTVF